MGMKTNIVLIALLFCLDIASLSAQNPDVAKNISEVKRDTSYIYAEATMKDLDESILGAKAILEVKVGDWLRNQYPEEDMELCITKAKEHSFEIQTRRGEYHRAFVYVKKSDIMTVSKISDVIVLQVPTKEEQVRVTPAEIISEESVPVVEEPRVTLTSDEEQMKAINKFYDIEPFIKGLQSKGRNVVYGKYATMPKDVDCHLFVYNRQGEVAAVLRKNNKGFVNLTSLAADNIDNYKNCGAIWLQLK